MFDSIRRYFEKRNKEIAAAEYRDGFEWAFGESLLEGLTLEEIENQMDQDGSNFDKGAHDALLIIGGRARLIAQGFDTSERLTNR